MANLVGRYTIRERIGQGAMADVYRAYDPNIQRELAIKVLRGELRQNRDYARRFLREAKAAGALSHPNIVTVYDVGEVDGFPYIAMELLDGQPLDKLMRPGARFEPQRVIDIGLQLAEALRYAHSQGVVHRDVKPSNIQLSADGRAVKLLDFGIARVAEAVAESESVKTQAGQVMGTPRYMSPEQALCGEVDGRSDLFSVGVILYELVTGKKAFAGASAATLALQITQAEPEPLAQAAPDTPRGLQFIITKLMAKRPERRFADGAALAEALRREAAVQEALEVERTGGRRGLSLSTKLALGAVAAVGVVLAVGMGVVLDRQDAAMQRMALTSGSAVSSFVASNAALRAADNATLPQAERDWLPVQAFVTAASADPNVRDLTVVDADGVIRGATDERRVGRPYRAPVGETVVRREGPLTVTALRGPRDGFRFTRPILYAGRSFGRVDVSLKRTELTAASTLSHVMMGVLGLAVLLATGLVSFATARSLTRPMRRLRQALTDAAGGNMEFRISHHRRDEIGRLFDAFNLLAASAGERMAQADPSLEHTTLGSAPVRPAKPTSAPAPDSPFAPRPAAPARPVAEPVAR